MRDQTVLLVAIAALVLVAAVPTAWVLIREAIRRVVTRRTIDRMARARRLLGEARAAGQSVEESAKSLRRMFDPLTVGRTMEAELLELGDVELRGDTASHAHPSSRGDDRRPWVVELYRHLDLAAQPLRAVRDARRWAERAHAAEILGLLGMPEAVPALVAALRDPHEDESSVKAAAARALARIRAASAIPLLVDELRTVDEYASPRVADALVAFGPDALPALEALLGEVGEAARPASRLWAARVLGRIGHTSSIGPLVERLRDRHDGVRIAAAEALGRIGDRRAIPPLVLATLRDPVAQVRAHAAAALGQVGDPSVVDTLVGALADPDYGTRILALEALETVRPSDTAPLERALRDHNPDVRRRAALALDRVGWLERSVEELGSDERAIVRRAYARALELGRAGLVDGLAAHLFHPRFEVRAKIVELLGELGDRRAAVALEGAADDVAWPVRARLAEALGRLRPDGGAAVLARLLGDAEPTVAELAAEALTAYPPRALAPLHGVLARAFDRGTPAARARLVQCLGRVGSAQTVQFLLHAADDPFETVRADAVRALGDHLDVLELSQLAPRLADPAVSVKVAAVDVIAGMGGEEAPELLLQALPGAPPIVRDRIAEALAASGGVRVVVRLGDLLLTSDDLEVRLGVIWTLGKIGDGGAVPSLARALSHEDARLRASAAGALGKIRTKEARAALIAAAEDRDPRTRAAVVNALGRQGVADEAVLGALQGRIDDPDAFVRNRAAVALGRLGGDLAEAVLDALVGKDRVDPAALVVARGLSATDAGVAAVAAALAEPELASRVRRFVGEEDATTRRELLVRLHLDDGEAAPAEGLELGAAISRYRSLLSSSQDPEARRVAANALAEVGGELGAQVLADALGSDPADKVRVQIVTALAGRLDSEVAAAAVARAVGDPCEEVALVAIRAAGRSRSPLLGERLFERLGTGPAGLVTAVEEALAELHAGDVAPFVDRLMGSSRTPVLVAGIRVLGGIGTPSLGRLLSSLLHSPEQAVQVAAARALARVPGPEAKASLHEALSHTILAVRLAAAEALFEASGADALPRLSCLTSDPAVSVRVRLAQMATSGGWARGAGLVEKLLLDPSIAVRAAALGTLLEMAEAETLGRFLTVWSEAAADVVARLRADPRGAAITKALADTLKRSPDPAVREGAVLGIAALSTPGFEEQVLPALLDPDPAVRVAAIAALAPLERAEVRQCLTALLSDPDPKVREAAQRSTLRLVR